MSEEKRYTLEEARYALAVRECRAHGHDFRVVANRTYSDPDGSPQVVVCDRCHASWRVERP